MYLAGNSVEQVFGGTVIKQGDRTPLGFNFRTENGELVSLTGTTVQVKVASDKGVVLEKQATISDEYTVQFAIGSQDITGAGDMRIEFTVTYPGGTIEKFPSDDWQRIRITPTLEDVEKYGVGYITFEKLTEELQNQFDEFTGDVNQQIDDQKQRVDNLISSTPQPSEIVDARRDENGNSFTNLKAHLDDKGNKINVLQKRFALSVADMKSVNVKAGDYITTLGYYFWGDGGGGTYVIKSSADTDDGALTIVLNNGLRAKLLYGTEINLRQFGAKGNANYKNYNNSTWYEDAGFTIPANDDTQALAKAIATNRQIKLNGKHIVNDSFEVSDIKITGGNWNSDSIIMTSSNKPIFIVKGGGFVISDCELRYNTFQSITNTKSIPITPKDNAKVDMCIVQRVRFKNIYSAIYSNWPVNGGEFYSCHFEDLKIESFSYAALYLVGGTGCVLSNIYAHNWADYAAKLINESEYVFYFGTYTEFFATQLNAEWSKPKGPVIVFNGMETGEFKSIHLEGIEFTQNYSSPVSFISSNIDLSSFNFMNCNLKAVTNIDMFKVEGRCRLKLNNIKERSHDTTGSLVTNLFVGAAVTHTDTAIFADNIQLEKFSRSTYFPINQYNQKPVKRIDNNIFEEKKNGKIITYANAIPSTNRWLQGVKVYNTNPTAGGYEGWLCIKGGYYTNAPTSDVTGTAYTAFTNTISVVKQGEFLVGDRIAIAGSSREFVITSINSAGTQFTLDQNIEVQVTNAQITFLSPVFKGFGLIEA